MVEIPRGTAASLFFVFLVGLQVSNAIHDGLDEGVDASGLASRSARTAPPWGGDVDANHITSSRRRALSAERLKYLDRPQNTRAASFNPRTVSIARDANLTRPSYWNKTNAANHIFTGRRDAGEMASVKNLNRTLTSTADVATPLPSVCDKRRMFRCLNGECISRTFWCDGSPDCSDLSDEQGCTADGGCKGHQFACVKTNTCIPILWKCDGEADCPDGSDELNCTSTATCLKHQYACSGGRCISASLVCDAEKDCPEGDDEEQCGELKCLAIQGHFKCLSGDCISPEETCDGKKDCDDGSDEGGRCDDRCKDEECSHQCYMTPRGPRCVCPSGWKLRSNSICEDLDECRGNVSLCDHFCVNVQGGFSCDCHQQYSLQPDNASCVANNKAPALLFFAQDQGVRVVNVRNTFYREIVESDEQIVGLALNPVDETLFWSTKDGIYKVNIKTPDIPKIIINKGIGIGEGLAVDWLGGNLYIADPTNGQVLVCSLNGVICYVVVGGRKHPRGIQLDMRNRYMYWSDVETSLIEKAGMDGSKQTVLVSKDISWPNAIALDQPAGRLYWLDAREDSAYSIRTDGTDRKQLVDAIVNHPFAMGVWNQYLYWTDWNHDHIRSCYKRNGKHVGTVLKGSTVHEYYGLIVFHPDMLNQGTNPCRDHPCSDLCLLSPTSAREYTCACPSYTMKLGPDKRTCVEEEGLTTTLVATENKIFQISHKVYGRNTLNPWRHDLKLHSIGDLEYEPTLKMVVISDSYNEVIHGISDGVTAVLVNNTKAVGLAIDWLRGNLYWVDSKMAVEMGRLRVRSLEHRTLVVSRLPFPTDVAVSPVLGYLFISGSNYDPYIMRCGLDGSNCQKIVSTDMSNPVSIAFDRDSLIKRLYWCDYGKQTIESVDPDGSKRLVLVSTANPDTGSPVFVMATGLSLMWSIEKSDTIFSASKVNLNLVSVISLELDKKSPRGLMMTETGWKVQSSIDEESYACRRNNGNCSHLCVGNGASEKVCVCESGYTLASDKLTCNIANCSGNLFLCPGSKTCISASWRCDGTRDCSDGSDEVGCIKETVCGAGKFRCSSGACIEESWTCDGVSDCPNGTDEKLEKCSNKTCSDNQWQCASGQCIPRMWVCDHRPECSDGSDERDCPTSCPDHKFTCGTGDCIPEKWRCDRDYDCADKSDEKECPETCGSGEFQCDNKRCVALSSTCDNDDDCGDRSDERLPSCSSPRSSAGTATVDCLDGLIACASKDFGQETVCISHSSVCNGRVDCPLGEDEDCSECHEMEFHCRYSRRCIPKGFLCDGQDDCDDGTDEGSAANCTVVATYTTTTQRTTTELYPNRDMDKDPVCPGMFRCLDGDCVPKESVCNKIDDCFDRSDEGLFCDNHCANNGGCQHECHPSPTGSYCSCHLGSHLADNGKECLDDVVCEEEDCSHVCVKARLQAFCSCAPGYNLQPDNRTCKPNSGEEFVVLARAGGVVMVGHNFQIKGKADTSLNLAIDNLAVDPVNDLIIYTDKRRGVIGTMPFKFGKVAGITKSKVLLDKRSHPQGLSYDPIAKNIYFSEFFSGQLASLEGGQVVERRSTGNLKTVTAHSMIMMCDMLSRCSVATHAPGKAIPSTSLAVRNRLLFSCHNSVDPEDDKSQIVYTFVDGSAMRVVRQHKMVRCGSLAVDEIKKRVYWTDLALSTVESVTWDGSRHRLVQKERVYSPVGLTLMGDKVIWINSKRRDLIRCSKYDVYNCEVKPMTTVGSSLFSVLPLVGAGPNRCASSACKHLCTSYSNRTKCLCPLGFREVAERPGSCEELMACKKHPCSGGQACEAHTDKDFFCRCDAGHRGLRCEVNVSPLEEESSSSAYIVVILLVLLVLVASGCGYYWYRKRPFTIWKGKGFSSNQSFRFVNPAFGVISDEAIINSGSSPAPSTNPSMSGNPPPYTFNPSIASSFENPFFKTDDIQQMNTSQDSAVASATDSTSINIPVHKVDLSSPASPGIKKQTSNNTMREFVFSPYNPVV